MSITLQEFLFLLVVLIGNTVESMTGFAGTLLAMPASVLLIGVDEAKTVLNVMALICCSWIAFRHRKHINGKEFRKITGYMFLGMIGGVVIYDTLPSAFLLKIYAVLIIAIALKKMFIKKNVTLPGLLLILTILGAGVIHGMFLSGGSLLVIYAVMVLRDKSEFRATLAAVWAVLDFFLFLNQARLGHVNSDTIPLIGIALVPLALGIALGNRLHHRINQNHFLLVTYVLLFISGVSLLVK
ncbi:sulfite exporter TauE/SafE family protein [Paenibacillus sp. FJAT-26967]|uniref:sulfite exporter TauE/SafE family protein n=1 Tax=Paenibacillus sp. FJAT-26967 TaxID=1729690 RepID=UPI000B1CBDB6|nr:sulfite exporter TauE/SafE family protein [Paenibacillus sp. FJAT-26967]